MLTALLLAATLQFTPPVHIPITLAGNFGEPRPNHFHGGIDVRTNQQEGIPVFAIGDGYVYRITVGTGYGNALYVRHPNGKTSVYAHLQGFVPTLRTMVSKWRLEHGQEDIIDEVRKPSPPADIRLNPSDFPVAQGQLIAMSGNTGSSQAPHLHLEIHHTENWAIIDPLDFLSQYLEDTEAPIAHAFMAYPVEGEGLFEAKAEKSEHPFTNYNLERTFTAWGKVGFGIMADDHMENSYQKYGIRKTTLLVDGEEVFKSNVDSIPWAMNRYVNCWGDYDHYFSTHKWFMKSFIDPGNPLPVIKANASRGIVDFNQERDFLLEYILTDAFGNESRYTFTVRGVKQDIPPAEKKSAANTLYWDRMNNFQLPGLQLVVRPYQLADNLQLTPSVEFISDGLSDAYSFRPSSSPLIRPAIISIRLKKAVAMTDGLYIDCDGTNLGGTFNDGWVTATTLNLGGTFKLQMPEWSED